MRRPIKVNSLKAFRNIHEQIHNRIQLPENEFSKKKKQRYKKNNNKKEIKPKGVFPDCE